MIGQFCEILLESRPDAVNETGVPTWCYDRSVDDGHFHKEIQIVLVATLDVKIQDTWLSDLSYWDYFVNIRL